ncbi:hypothetical protein F2P81_016085 [Scophthalmus maximus]|uniref:Uncharacterized protein n=1 Tax=Scophthalmus maximus TaxID=52904 RepID=A0A6A4SI13_SCOMX|nr:hypothetical protein F2P81_016085 [Scophthalmus maximus]
MDYIAAFKVARTLDLTKDEPTEQMSGDFSIWRDFCSEVMLTNSLKYQNNPKYIRGHTNSSLVTFLRSHVLKCRERGSSGHRQPKPQLEPFSDFMFLLKVFVDEVSGAARTVVTKWIVTMSHGEMGSIYFGNTECGSGDNGERHNVIKVKSNKVSLKSECFNNRKQHRKEKKPISSKRVHVYLL